MPVYTTHVDERCPKREPLFGYSRDGYCHRSRVHEGRRALSEPVVPVPERGEDRSVVRERRRHDETVEDLV